MLDKLFRKNSKPGELPKGAASPVARPDVPYDPGLIIALTYQHRAMAMLLVKASEAAQDGAYEEVRDSLEEFKTLLAEHMRKETTQLHPYLTMHLKGEDSKDILKDMRTNSARIEQSVEGFLRHYSGYPVTDVNAERFVIEIEGVNEEFGIETEREEGAFYTLYMSPESY